MTTHSRPYCAKYGYDPARIAERLRLVGLNRADDSAAQQLHDDVIAPHAEAIAETFYAELARHPDFDRILAQGHDRERLRRAFREYLLTLGVGFERPEYFEQRLRVGHTHARVGVPLSLYQASYSILQRLILEHMLPANQGDTTMFAALARFLLKISALDTSLAAETYHLTEVQDLHESIDHLRTETRTLHRRIDTDPLTGLASRDYTLAVLASSLGMRTVAGPPLFVAMADLDLFKSVNDKLGHVVGDEVLRGVAARIAATVRDVDTVGRYGGEEFLIILDRASALTARKITERIRRHVAGEPIHVNDHAIHMTVSLGLANALPGDTVEQAVGRADSALYRAKQRGRNCVVMDLRPGGGVVRPAAGP